MFQYVDLDNRIKTDTPHVLTTKQSMEQRRGAWSRRERSWNTNVTNHLNALAFLAFVLPFTFHPPFAFFRPSYSTLSSSLFLLHLVPPTTAFPGESDVARLSLLDQHKLSPETSLNVETGMG